MSPVVLRINSRFLRLIGVIFSPVLIPVSMSAATYYVDFSSGGDANAGTSKTAPWQHAPGMTGCSAACANARLNDGDVVVFKGGVTWTSSFPWTIAGGSSAGVTYTTDHSWYAGASYAQPVFDDGHADPGATGMANSSSAYITLNDLSWVNCGTSQSSNSDKCLVFTNTHDITITNSRFATESWIAVYFIFSSPGSYSNFTFTGNDWSHTSGAIWFASAQANTSMHNVTYNSNSFHDFASQIGGGVHADGAWHYFAVPASDSTQWVDGVTFCDNRFYGDYSRSFGTSGGMTAFFFSEGSLSGTICNNDMSFNPVQSNMFDGLIVLSGNGNSHPMATGIYNNSLANIGTNAMSAGIHLYPTTPNVTVKNNIMSGMQYAVDVEDSDPTFVSDYNLYNSSSGQLVFGGSFVSYAQWQSGGRDAHSKLGMDPAWVGAPGNEQLQSSSPGIGTGLNLSSLSISILDHPFNGGVRALSGAWDMGAYQFSQGVTLVPPTRVTANAN